MIEKQETYFLYRFPIPLKQQTTGGTTVQLCTVQIRE